MLISTPRLQPSFLLLASLATLLIILGCNRLAAAPDFQGTTFDGGSFHGRWSQRSRDQLQDHRIDTYQ